ncbi:unnamed protein product [Oikopleura dioica]|uniref:Uncharacterized protein n=1 Tax=Oikopleura dioica TaxID=34765 RepID=E4YBX1_OIKDI|nr:unnamed protein product [Oikopleura dioica]
MRGALLSTWNVTPPSERSVSADKRRPMTTIKLSQLSRCKRESHKTQITKNEAFNFHPCFLNFCELSEPSQKSSRNRPGPASIQPAHSSNELLQQRL